MTLDFGVDELLPRARGGGVLKMGLAKLDESEWLQRDPDLVARAEGFAAYPEGIQLSPESEAPGAELTMMLGLSGGLPEAARAHHEDMCLLTLRPGEDQYRLVGAAVAWPSDWTPADKLGLPLRALHAPIQGYEEQLASGVDNFMAKLKPGAIYGRCNWFIAATGDKRWVAEPPEQAFAHVTPENAGETLFVRSERQTLRRLPQTGAILFTIGIYIAPFGELSQSNQQRLAAAVASLIEGEGDRRGAGAYAGALIGYANRREETS
ncbi:heme-dependent oxidative N-demethylase family protein [Qipengyuania sp. 902]|uniref:heme-dependent oxidative N-demethylase family protein n=1 Tax=Qipengyuania sp. 902 TaxID=3417565 RepID=UPI003EBC40BC